MPKNVTIRPVAVAVFAAVAMALLLLAATAKEAAAGCRGEHAKHSTRTASSAMFCLVNAHRARHGLRRLRYDGRLKRVARRHAADMVRFNFLGHNSPARGGLVARVKRTGFGRNRAWTVAENLAYGSGRGAMASFVARGWMRSAIHRHAMLHRSVTSMGVGVVRGMPGYGRRRGGLSYVVTFAG